MQQSINHRKLPLVDDECVYQFPHEVGRRLCHHGQPIGEVESQSTRFVATESKKCTSDYLVRVSKAVNKERQTACRVDPWRRPTPAWPIVVLRILVVRWRHRINSSL